jgi:HD superfamily phosphohydrolase YqeK
MGIVIRKKNKIMITAAVGHDLFKRDGDEKQSKLIAQYKYINIMFTHTHTHHMKHVEISTCIGNAIVTDGCSSTV